ncbi:MAG: NAD-dependent epimerase/dehydratase family protein [Ignavibacteria bacterium]
MSKKEICLVYGGGGFIGSHLCECLLDNGYEVVIFDKLNFTKKNIISILDRLKVIEGDFNNEVDLKNSLNGVDYVYHLVSSTLPASSNENPIYDVESNLISSLKLFKECSIRNIKKLIFLSSGGTVYGIPETLPVKENYFSSPICSYGIVKRTIEEYLFLFNKMYGLNYNVFRLSNPYGERQNPNAAQGAIAVFVNKAIHEEPIEIWGDGKIVRDYIYVKDAVEVLTRAIKIKSTESVFNLSSGQGHTINELIEVIKKISGKKLNINYKDSRNVDVPVSILDNELVKKVFDWKPNTTIDDGIRRTYDYLLKADI